MARPKPTTPEQEADYIIEHLGNPDNPRTHKADAAGISLDRAMTIERRIESRYAELAERVRPVSRDILERRVSERLDIIDAFLTVDKFLEKLEKTSLKDIGIYEGILLDKLAAIRAAPSVGITTQDQAKLDQLAPALLKVLEQRGLTAVATERRIEFTTNEPSPANPGSAESAVERTTASVCSGAEQPPAAGPPAEPAQVLQASVEAGTGSTP